MDVTFHLSTSSLLCNIWKSRYRQNNTGYPILSIGFQSIFDNLDNLIPCIVLPISWLPDIVWRTACTQNVPMDVTFHLSTSSLLCNIWKPRYRQNNTGYPILSIGFQSIFDNLNNPIPCIVLPISWLPDISQKTTCTQNVPMDVTFHLKYVPAFQITYGQRN